MKLKFVSSTDQLDGGQWPPFFLFPRAPRYQSDVAALTDFGYDAVKLDGCGKQTDRFKFLVVTHLKFILAVV